MKIVLPMMDRPKFAQCVMAMTKSRAVYRSSQVGRILRWIAPPRNHSLKRTSAKIQEPKQLPSRLQQYHSSSAAQRRPQRSASSQAKTSIAATQTRPYSSDIKSLAPTYLRDLCQCPQCVDASSKQKLFETADIPGDCSLTQCEYSPERNGWVIAFDKDIPGFKDHDAFVPESVIKKALNVEPATKGPERTTWNRADMEQDVLWVDYDAYQSSDDAALKALQRLRSHGLVFLRNVPADETSVIKIAERIGPLRDSFYGRTWDVKSVPDAKNIAYTHRYLGLHMDLLYMTNPPHLQLLHSLKAQAPGGESLFSDSYLAAETIRNTSDRHFQSLCFEPINYHYNHHPSQHYYTSRTVVELDIQGIEGGHGGSSVSLDSFSQPTEALRQPHSSQRIRRINWSPPFQGPLTPDRFRSSGQATDPKSESQQFFEAIKMFKDMVNADKNVFELKLKEGECVIFDNRRVLHARRAFDAQAGERWLKGAYVDDDVFFSRLRVLEAAAATADPAALAQ